MIRLRRARDAVDLVVDHSFEAFGLGLDFDDRRVPRPEGRRLLCLQAHDLGVLGAQRRNGLRLHRFREGADVVFGFLHGLDLFEAGFRCRGAGACGRQLIVEIGKLLLVDELPVGVDDVVARSEGLDALFSLMHTLFQFVEACRQRLRDLTGGIGADLRLLGQIGLGNGIGEARGLCGVFAGDSHIHDVSALGAGRPGWPS